MNDLTKKHFDVMDGGVALVIFIALQYVFYFLLSLFPGILNNQVAYIILSVILESLFAVAALLIAVIRRKPLLEATTLNKKVNWAIVGFCALISVASIILFTDLSSAFSYTLEYFGFKSVLSDVTITGIGGYLLNIVTVCALPAFVEELLFRGVVLNSFRGISKWAGITVSAVSFMIMHGNPDQTIHQLLLGFVLAYIVWETKNIWCGILIHFFNNFIAITLTYVLSLINSGSGEQEPSAPIAGQKIVMLWVLGLAMAAVGFALVWWLTKYIKKQSAKANPQKQESTEVLVDGEPVEAEVSVETPAAQAQPAEEESQPQKPLEPKQQPTPLAIVFTAASYVAFFGYFIYEWISVLLKGLGH